PATVTSAAVGTAVAASADVGTVAAAAAGDGAEELTFAEPVDFVDTAWKELMQEVGLNYAFPSTGHVQKFLDLYEEKTNIFLGFRNVSKRNTLICYCRSHGKDCPFSVKLKLREADQCYVQHIFEYQHKGVPRAATAKGGRAHKKRRKNSMDDSLTTLTLTKHDKPNALDVRKSEKSLKGRIQEYAACYRCMREFCDQDRMEELLSYQFIIPYLMTFKGSNPGTVAEYEMTPNRNSIRRVFVCPGTSAKAMKFMPLTFQ
ncbi:MAG: hypothetical protein AAGM67_21130, partial [Bacteroidota bacterium]